METLLPPIEKPKGLMMKLAYAFSRRQFGKVIAPLKVHAARLPAAFGMFYGKVGQLDKKLALPAELAVLVRAQVARINVCSFCLDASRWGARHASLDEAKFDALESYGTSPLFTEAERAALDYASELTTTRRVEPATFARLRRHWPEREVCEIVWLVASEHLYNVTNLGLSIHSDMLCELRPRRARQS